ncbi:MAG: manganese efflux pump [Clostridia bacterium]|nr:manganese efflux pump [Clostridia bacterium]
MQLYEVILIGIALSIDACAITIANCTTYKCSLNKSKEWSMPIAFAIFQGVMPLIGYFIGSLFASYIASVSKFVTAAIFLFLAVKIIVDIFKEQNEVFEVDKNAKSSFTIGVVILQAVATSIDALAVGVTMIDLTFSVFIAVTVIAAVTFALVALALLFGKTLGNLFGKYAEWVGAFILLVLSIKSLIEAFL